MSEPLVFYCHPKTIDYRDYGAHLDFEHGLAWSTDNGESGTHSFERGDFESLFAEKLAILGDYKGIELRRGVNITVRCDMNPHGFI